MTRLSFLALAFALAACGADADAPTAQPASGTATLPTGGPVEAVPSERQRLSIAQLLQYLPETIGSYTYQSTFSVADPETPRSETDAPSGVTLTYGSDAGGIAPSIRVTLYDLIDAPETMASERRQLDQRTYAGSASESDGTAAGFPTQEFGDLSTGPVIRFMIAERFMVTVGQASGSRDGFSVDDLVEFVEASPLPSLAEAPAYAEAGSPAIPEWAEFGVTRALERDAASRAEREAQNAAAEAERASAGPLLPCDEILPASEVARVLGVASVRVRPTPFESEGENCNRGYSAEGIEGAVLLIVSHYTDEETPQSALRVASDHDNKVNERPLPGLNGREYTHDLSTGTTHIAHFASGVDFVELKASPGLADAPETTPEQLAEIAAIAAANLER